MSKRQLARGKRQSAFWREKERAAGSDPVAKADVAWDHLRATATVAPHAQRDAAWTEIKTRLDELRKDIEQKYCF